MADRSFPGPYMNSVPERPDPIMKTVPFPTMDIGARNSGLPKSISSDEMNIRHVGGETKGTLKN